MRPARAVVSALVVAIAYVAVALGPTRASAQSDKADKPAAKGKAGKKVRVLLWSEQTEPRDLYPTGISGALANHLSKLPAFEARTAQLSDPDAGITDAVLEATDVLVWWGHLKHGAVPDAVVEMIVRHIRERGMGFIGLHSAHYSKALKAALRATGSWSSYKNFGWEEKLWAVLPGHPIAKGVGDFTLLREEIYTEPYEVPEPEAVIFEATWPSGHRTREVMAWTLDKGRFVYIRPGHETYPVYYMPEMQKIVENSILWAARRTNAPAKLARREAGPAASTAGPARALLKADAAPLVEAKPRAPIAPQAPFAIKTGQAMEDLDRALRPGSRSVDLVANAPLPYTVQVMREERFELPAAEIHDGKDHVFLVTEGKTTFYLGGKLIDAKETSSGEWRGPRLEGSQIFDAPKGTLVTIPRGTPHFRSTKDGAATLVSVSIFSKNVAPAKPAAR
jgi:trehalose utilization protein/mannose-6-phosphate isomerase-like protein (cupin superfamily)